MAQVPVLHGELVDRLRYTWWSESLSPVTGDQVQQSISRNYFDLQARIVGPVFNRIFNTRDSGYAEKVKHTIEPWVNLQRVTSIDMDNRVVRLDSTDYIVGGTTRVTYGLNNRVYAKRKARFLEPYAMLWIHLAFKMGQGRSFGLAVVRR